MEGKPNFRMQRTLCFWEGDLRRKTPCVRKVHVNSWVVLSWTRMNSRRIFFSVIFATQAAFEKVIFDTWNTLPKMCFATSTSVLYNHLGVADKIWNWSIFKGDWNKKKEFNSVHAGGAIAHLHRDFGEALGGWTPLFLSDLGQAFTGGVAEWIGFLLVHGWYKGTTTCRR